jgi:hypothetical protein
MVSKEPLRVRVTTDREAVEAMEAVEADGVPRVIERDGHAIVIIAPADEIEYVIAPNPSPGAVKRSLALGGAWESLGGAELGDEIHRWREESPPSPPVSR